MRGWNWLIRCPDCHRAVYRFCGSPYGKDKEGHGQRIWCSQSQQQCQIKKSTPALTYSAKSVAPNLPQKANYDLRNVHVSGKSINKILNCLRQSLLRNLGRNISCISLHEELLPQFWKMSKWTQPKQAILRWSSPIKFKQCREGSPNDTKNNSQNGLGKSSTCWRLWPILKFPKSWITKDN